MPKTVGTESDVTDYISRLLEYKYGLTSSDELSGDDQAILQRTNNLQREVGTSLTFKKLSKDN